MARDVTVTIEAAGVVLEGEHTTTERVEAGESVVFGWSARVLEDGTATVRFSATTEGYGDAVELSLPVHLDVTPEDDRHRWRRRGRRRRRGRLPARLRHHRQRLT